MSRVDIHLERNWASQSVTVYARVGSHLLTVPAPGKLDHVPIDESAAQPDAFLIELPDYVLAAIVAAGQDLLPPGRAQANHLADAINVRDRLLTLVERTP